MHKLLQLILSASLLLTAVAYQHKSAPVSLREATSAANPGIQAKMGKLITTVPSTLAACSPSSEVTVKWDAQSANLTNVEVWVGRARKPGNSLPAAGKMKPELVSESLLALTLS